MSANIYRVREYENFSVFRRQKNNANQSQFRPSFEGMWEKSGEILDLSCRNRAFGLFPGDKLAKTGGKACVFG
jgi:hypothetical protein